MGSARPDLSLRLAQSDPWLDAEERLIQCGVLVDGVVTGIMPYGIFVELEPGVTGLVHRSRFPRVDQRRARGCLLAGRSRQSDDRQPGSTSAPGRTQHGRLAATAAGGHCGWRREKRRRDARDDPPAVRTPSAPVLESLTLYGREVDLGGG